MAPLLSYSSLSKLNNGSPCVNLKTDFAQDKSVDLIAEKEIQDVFDSRRGLTILGIYNRPRVFKLKDVDSIRNLNISRLNKLGIPNLALTTNDGLRGESLSSKKNRKFLKEVHENGVTTIIDLRDKYTSTSFPELCEQNNLEYFNIPIDSSSVSDRKIIDNLPLLFELIDRGHFYIACAQGLHRTDIALSLNYVFNPKCSEPPYLLGHFRNDDFKYEDIARRLNSIKKSLTPEDLEKMGWDDSFEEEFHNRKKYLSDYNKSLLSNEE